MLLLIVKKTLKLITLINEVLYSENTFLPVLFPKLYIICYLLLTANHQLMYLLGQEFIIIIIIICILK